MEKKVIFDLPEEVSIAEIILNIFKKFNIEDDTLSPDSKLVAINSACKNFFAKKITENDFLELSEKKLKTTKENAVGIIDDLKKQLIFSAKEVVIPAETTTQEEVELNATLSPKQSMGVQEVSKEPNAIKPAVEKIINNKITPPKRISKINKLIEEKDKSSVPSVKPKGPDSYREPIE